MRTNRLAVVIALALLAALFAPALAPGAAQARQDPVRIGALPILDVLPFYVAEQNGYFEEEGVPVEMIPVSSALERDQLFLAGELDGMLNDLISTGIFNQDEVRAVIVAQARRAYEDAPQFRVLAAPDSGIATPEDLRGVEIGISENSVIHYIGQRILEDAGLSADDLSWRAEPNIPIRYQLLMEGQMEVVVLPDPLAQAAIEGGAILVADDTALVETQFSQSVISFSTALIEDHPEYIEGILRAWNRAAEDINADPEAYRDLWLEKTPVPDSVRDTYRLPPFPTYAITDEAAWNDTMTWLVEQEIIDDAPAYEDSVNGTIVLNLKMTEGIGEISEDAPDPDAVSPDATAEPGETSSRSGSG
ncbi:MAG: ABC transporter substrate-binding protein [Chloroflexi bacterium]|nr:ABC transporter substrate-binding protein [Chloroflexota bacterium]